MARCSKAENAINPMAEGLAASDGRKNQEREILPNTCNKSRAAKKGARGVHQTLGVAAGRHSLATLSGESRGALNGRNPAAEWSNIINGSDSPTANAGDVLSGTQSRNYVRPLWFD
jgi:hypothetical protein